MLADSAPSAFNRGLQGTLRTAFALHKAQSDL